MGYQPKTGDRVVVTRKCPDGQTHTYEGTVRITPGLDGYTVDGQSMAGADTMRRNHGVEQTIRPA